MDVASIDIGANSVRMVIAQVHAKGLTVLADDERFARLGAGVDATRTLSDEAIERVADAVRTQRSLAERYAVGEVHAVATSAARDARNGDALRLAMQGLGVSFEIIDGEEEATWAFMGALSALPHLTQATVIDIGGGSTELAWGARHRPPERRTLQIGSVRLTERGGGPQTQSEAIARAIHAAALPTGLPLPWVITDSPGTTLATLEAGLSGYDGPRLEGTPLHRDAIARWTQRMGGLTPAEVLALAPEAMNGRADLMAAGARILHTLVATCGPEQVHITDRGLAHGWAIRCARRRDD